MITVSVTPMIGSNEVILQAWEPDAGHSTIQRHPDGWWMGKIGTSPLPAEIRAMDAGNDRLSAVVAFIAADKDRAYAIICDHESHAESHGKRDGAQVYMDRDDLA